MADALVACAGSLAGVADALRYRAAADADDMLDLLAAAIDDQADALRGMAHPRGASPMSPASVRC